MLPAIIAKDDFVLSEGKHSFQGDCNTFSYAVTSNNADTQQLNVQCFKIKFGVCAAKAFLKDLLISNPNTQIVFEPTVSYNPS